MCVCLIYKEKVNCLNSRCGSLDICMYRTTLNKQRHATLFNAYAFHVNSLIKMDLKHDMKKS